MQLMLAGQITDHNYRVVSKSDSYCAQDRCTGTLLGTGSQRHDSQRLWELDWLHLPSAVSTSQSATTTTSGLTGYLPPWFALSLIRPFMFHVFHADFTGSHCVLGPQQRPQSFSNRTGSSPPSIKSLYKAR